MEISKNLRTVIAFLDAIADGSLSERASEFYSESILQTEYPNAITPHGANRDMNALIASFNKGSKVVRRQWMEILHSYASGDTVIIEAIWKAELAIPLGRLKEGEIMQAWFAQFFEFSNGKIIRQRNYDCFEPVTGKKEEIKEGLLTPTKFLQGLQTLFYSSLQ